MWGSSEWQEYDISASVALEAQETQPPPLKRFRLLAQDTRSQLSATAHVTALGVDAELERYIQEVQAAAVNCDAIAFWQQREGSYPNLSAIAVDLVSAPASQAYVERVFSTCGDLCARKRNRATTGLENRVFLMANKKLFNK